MEYKYFTPGEYMLRSDDKFNVMSWYENFSRKFKSLLDDIFGVDSSSIRIKFVYTVKNSDKIASIRKVSDLMKMWVNADYVIMIYESNFSDLDDVAKEAVLFHELCHIKVVIDKKGNKKFKLRKHDVEEFVDVVKKYGAYQNSLNFFVSILRKKDGEEKSEKT